MDQSEYNNLTKRSITIELIVGIFTLLGVASVAYLSVGIAGLKVGLQDQYSVKAQFGNISGLKYGSPVELAGVQIGQVSRIDLVHPNAILTLNIDNGVPLFKEDELRIKTKGIIGDRYIQVDPGGSDEKVPADATITLTTDSLDIEDVIGKVINQMGSKDSSKGSENK